MDITWKTRFCMTRIYYTIRLFLRPARPSVFVLYPNPVRTTMLYDNDWGMLTIVSCVLLNKHKQNTII